MERDDRRLHWGHGRAKQHRARRRRHGQCMSARSDDTLSEQRPLPSERAVADECRLQWYRPGGADDQRHRILLVLRTGQRRAGRESAQRLRAAESLVLGVRLGPDQCRRRPDRHGHKDGSHEEVSQSGESAIRSRSGHRRFFDVPVRAPFALLCLLAFPVVAQVTITTTPATPAWGGEMFTFTVRGSGCMPEFQSVTTSGNTIRINATACVCPGGSRAHVFDTTPLSVATPGIYIVAYHTFDFKQKETPAPPPLPPGAVPCPVHPAPG